MKCDLHKLIFLTNFEVLLDFSVHIVLNSTTKIAPNHSKIKKSYQCVKHVQFRKTQKFQQEARRRQKWVENHGYGVSQSFPSKSSIGNRGIHQLLPTMFCMTICIGNRTNFTIGISWSRMTTNKKWILLNGFFLSSQRPKSFSSAVMNRISHSHCQLISKTIKRGDHQVRVTGLKCL